MTRSNLEALRAAKDVARNPYAWPGGYQRFLMLADGDCLCPACVKCEFKEIVWATMHSLNAGWLPAAGDINWEDAELYCAHCNAQIPPAYGA
jgi:hypothetical protein